MTARRRNVLLITADQWRGECLSALDHPCVKTPTLDGLIRDGIAFRNHYSVCAPCGPARASLLTGMYMHNHRSITNGTPLDDRHTNVAHEVRKVGFRPILFGYTDTSLDPRQYPEQDIIRHGYENLMPGFEEGLLLPSEQPDAWIADLRAKGYEVSNIADAYRPMPVSESGRGRTFAPPCYHADDSQTAFLTRRCIDHLGNSKARGWFVHLSYLRPHPPFIAPPPYNGMYDPQHVPMPVRTPKAEQQAQHHPWLAEALGPLGDWFDPWMREMLDSEDYDREMRQVRATYYGLITKVDHYLGQVIEFLKESGEYDNTLIIMTSDHGELLGDRWLFGKRGYFDASYHIPLIVRDPEQLAKDKGRIVDAFTESVDILPTILDVLGLDIPAQCDGRSLRPFIHNGHPSDWREEAHWEYDFRDVDDDQLERRLGISMDECTLSVIRDGRYKYVHFAALPPLLFDLEKDPAELNDLAGDPDYASVRAVLAGRMLSWRMCSDERVLTGFKVSRDGIRWRGRS